MNNGTTRFVGLDVHKATITVALCEAAGAPTVFGTIANDPDAIRKLVKQLGRASQLRVAYEAGATGFALQRQLTKARVACVVVAPALIPRASGPRVKTDKRDAVQLARLLRSGDLTPVWVPSEADEALRDLVRARYDAKGDLLRAKNRLSKFLLRQGITPPAGIRPWSVRFEQWLNQLSFAHPPAQVVFTDCRTTVRFMVDRVRQLEAELRRGAQDSRQAATIAALQALRGIGLLSAVTIAAETGDLRRFGRARSFMGFTGLTSSERSSGPTQRRGGITRTGNAYLRHVLVQAAHNARHQPRRAAPLRQRQAGLPQDLVDLAWRAQLRLHRRYHHLTGRLGRPKAVVAVARELAGFVWAIGKRMPEECVA